MEASLPFLDLREAKRNRKCRAFAFLLLAYAITNLGLYMYNEQMQMASTRSQQPGADTVLDTSTETSIMYNDEQLNETGTGNDDTSKESKNHQKKGSPVIVLTGHSQNVVNMEERKSEKAPIIMDDKTSKVIQMTKYDNIRRHGRAEACGPIALGDIETVPQLHMKPKTGPMGNWIHVHVLYPVYRIFVKLKNDNELCIFRLGNVDDTPTEAYFNLGLGRNICILQMVDKRTSKVMMSTIMVIDRQYRGIWVPASPALNSMPICVQKQECDLPFVKDEEKCGLQNTSLAANWGKYLDYSKTLKQCDNNFGKGQWVLPCYNCSDHMTCVWGVAQWQPDDCTYHIITRAAVRKKLQNKTVLFLGDSTLRGIMYYLILQTNGTLEQWAQSHSVVLYDNVGHNTTFGFSYYPLLETMEDCFKGLLNKLHVNNTKDNVILVVGGTTWMLTSHLRIVKKILLSYNITAKVIVKSFGSRFLLNRYNSLQEQLRSLQQGNNVLWETSNTMGYKVMDTWQPTISRFREFLQGKCACHFHRIRRVTSGNQTLHYVDGNINHVYSEMLFSTMCSD